MFCTVVGLVESLTSASTSNDSDRLGDLDLDEFRFSGRGRCIVSLGGGGGGASTLVVASFGLSVCCGRSGIMAGIPGGRRDEEQDGMPLRTASGTKS